MYQHLYSIGLSYTHVYIAVLAYLVMYQCVFELSQLSSRQHCVIERLQQHERNSSQNL